MDGETWAKISTPDLGSKDPASSTDEVIAFSWKYTIDPQTIYFESTLSRLRQASEAEKIRNT